MKKLTLFIFLTFLLSLNATILNVNHNGTMDYTVIQEAVNAAANGDTILVHPGEYIGYTRIEGKYLTLASLYLLDPQDEYIGTTILRGIEEHSVIEIFFCEQDTVTIEGFTITGGHGSYETENSENKSGGGILAIISNVKINHNVIKKNQAYGGGGIVLSYCGGILSGNSIHDNQAYIAGGVTANLGIVFDPVNKNSIYNNNGYKAADLIAFNAESVCLDTISVLPINKYYINSIFSNGDDNNEIVSAEHAYFEEVDADLFVSLEGYDSNGGLSWETALKTISWAARKMKSNPENPNTIYIGEGDYTDDCEKWNFPIILKKYANLIGVGEVNFFSEREAKFITNGYNGLFNVNIENITMTRIFPTEFIGSYKLIGIYGKEEEGTSNLTMNNVNLVNCTGYSSIKSTAANVEYKNSKIENVEDTFSYFYGDQILDGPVTYVLENIQLNDIERCYFRLGGSEDFEDRFQIINSSFTNLSNYPEHWGDDAFYHTILGIDNQSYTTIANCTFADNYSDSDTGDGTIGVTYSSTKLELINNLFYNNEEYCITVYDNPSYDSSLPNTITYKNNLFGAGEQRDIAEIHNEIWEEGNIFETDPLFVEDDTDLPTYSLSHLSPAINAGTLEYPEDMEIPEYDLAGNPRIYGNGIDIGAYEWQGTVDNEEEVIAAPEQVKIYPNPINLSSASRMNTIIELDIKHAGKVEVGIYNLRGQKVKTLLDAEAQPSKFELHWNGCGDNGQLVSSGQYFCRIKQYGQTIAKKMMVIK